MAAADYGMSRLYDFDGKTGTITPKDTSAIQEVGEEECPELPAASDFVGGGTATGCDCPVVHAGQEAGDGNQRERSHSEG